MSYGNIANRLNVCKSTVAWTIKHSHVNPRNDTYDWTEVQDYYDQGNGATDTINFFGMSNATWCKAIKRGSLVVRAKVVIPLSELLVEDRPQTSRNHLKMRLLKENVLEEVCSECGIRSIWNGKPLVLQLEHINGKSTDNRLENLCLLCPNCHSQTMTFAGRNCKKTPATYCVDCKSKINTGSQRCRICSGRVNSDKSRLQNKVRPSCEELKLLLWEKPTVQIATDFGVSDKAVEKWAKAYELTKPPRGYWAKVQFNKIVPVRT